MAATVERSEGRYVPGRSAAGGPGRGRSISALAAPPPPHATRPDLPVGGVRTRRRGFRNLDASGHAIHRQLVPGPGLENYSPHDPPGPNRPRRALIAFGTASAHTIHDVNPKR